VVGHVGEARRLVVVAVVHRHRFVVDGEVKHGQNGGGATHPELHPTIGQSH
jgi:hypothetical protein